MTKLLMATLYAVVVVSMGCATIIEKYHGTDFVSANIYGAWWFTAVWGMLAAFAISYFIKRRVRNASVCILHLSFVIILAGALLTHITAERGTVHLRLGQSTDTFTAYDGKGGTTEKRLPFTIRLDRFNTTYYDGTDAPSDYRSEFTITDNGRTSEGTVSMNKIYSHRGIRLYQSSYDNDGRGSHLSLNSDPWGIPVTYTGYSLLFISLIWMLIDPKGRYRQLFRSPLLKKGVLSIISVMFVTTAAHAAPTALPKETAEKFGELNILYNDRICPLQTFAVDFTKKLCGKPYYKGYTAEQVLTGFIFWGDEWSAEPIIRIKNGQLRETMQLPAYCSANTFFNRDMGGYILGPYVQESYRGNNDKFHQDVMSIDDRLMLIMELRRGTLLKIFPYTHEGITTWHSPTENLPATVPQEHRLYIANAFSLIYQEVIEGDNDEVVYMTDKMKRYQEKNGGNSLPTSTQICAERIYNRIPFATILFMVNLAFGFVTLLVEIVRMTKVRNGGESRNGVGSGTDTAKKSRWPGMVCMTVMQMSLAALTLCEALRWIISRTVPMGNGYETMLFVAWVVMILSVIAYRKFRIALTFGFLMSGFFLLVSHISQMDPNISHVMPVLNSPLLSVHVSVIMISFALLALTFVCGVTALIIAVVGRIRHGKSEATAGYSCNSAAGCSADVSPAAVIAGRMASLQLLSRLFLYPALTTLGIGIFVGAIWANVSWGQYWGWDPKEVWALITFMVYAIAVHTQSLPALSRPLRYHIFMTLAFLTVLMTYFGVNYVLGGMHSYA